MSWRPTSALVRAGVVSAVLLLTGVLTGRPDVVVLAVPLVGITAAGLLGRPGVVPRFRSSLGHGSLREGEATTLRVSVENAADVEHATLALTRRRWQVTRPAQGVTGQIGTGQIGTGQIGTGPTLGWEVPLTTQRWGVRPAGDGLVMATSAWAGFRWGPAPLPGHRLTTLPLPGGFDTTAPAPHPAGLVGGNPSRRPGEGSEFGGIRPFGAGDRLRRIQWRVSLRTGTLHVTTPMADQDTAVLLVVDAGLDAAVDEPGAPAEGRPDRPGTSLDTAVRAAGAIAEHYLRRGDRVGLRVLGPSRNNTVRTGAGGRHLRRILDTLAQITPGQRVTADASRLTFGVGNGSVVVMLSPMLTDATVATTVSLARRVDTIVVDTLPDLSSLTDPVLRVAWRLRILEREALLTRLQRAGVPVVGWRGPGTLDEVLRRLGRRAAMPRVRQR